MARAKIDGSTTSIQDEAKETLSREEQAVPDAEPDRETRRRSLSLRMPGGRTVAAALIAGLLVGGLAAAAVLRQTPVYLSRSILLIDQPHLLIGGPGEGVVLKLNQLRLKYALIAHTPRITSGVAKRIGLPDAQVAGRINVTLPGPSLILLVEGRSDDRRKARLIANGAGEELVAFVKAEMDANKIPEQDRIVMSVVAAAQAGAKVEPSRSHAMAIGSISGILALTSTFILVDILKQRSASR
jgi:capsular polysaccharide biosynthesis protein